MTARISIDFDGTLDDFMALCPLTAREGPYLLTCCLPAGHDGCCWVQQHHPNRRGGLMTLSLRSWPPPCDGSYAEPLYVDVINGRCECPECHGEYAIRRNGTVRFHRRK